jgi:Zn-dependent protease
MLAITVILATLLISITLHEAMHAFAAHWLGDDTAHLEGRLTLNPIKHVDPFLTVLMPIMLFLAGAPPLGAAKPVPFNPARVKYDEFGAAIVGIAGPLTNLALALVGAFLLRIAAGMEGLGGVTVGVLYLFILVNVALFVFNMIPFPPLDGSRVFYAFAPEPLQRLMAQIESFGLFGFVVFFLLTYNFLLPLIRNIVGTIMLFLTGIPSPL